MHKAVRMAVGVAGLLGLTSAHAQTSSADWQSPRRGRSLPYTFLDYRSAPSFADLLAAYPEKARAEKVSGVVSMECRVGSDERLGDCSVFQEQPKNYGFGKAARALAPRFLAPRRQNDSAMTDYYLQVSIAFTAEALESPQPVIGRPKWIATPGLDDLAAVAPAEARKASVYQARVVMSCTVGEAGALEGCRPVSEDPGGLGYGEAALSLAKSFRLSVWTAEGLPVIGAQVRVPIRFELEEVFASEAARQ